MAEKGRLVEIVEDDEIRDWQFVDPETSERYVSKFQLRVVPQSVQRQWRQRFTRKEWARGQRVETLDVGQFTDECLDYAIRGWSDVTSKHGDLPCEREYKLKLPEVVKAEIIRLCVGRELGELQRGNSTEEEEESRPPLQAIRSAKA